MDRRSAIRNMIILASAPAVIKLETLMPVKSKYVYTTVITVGNLQAEDRVHVYFQDGTQLDANDVKYFYNRCEFRIPQVYDNETATLMIRNTSHQYKHFRSDFTVRDKLQIQHQRVKDNFYG